MGMLSIHSMVDHSMLPVKGIKGGKAIQRSLIHTLGIQLLEYNALLSLGKDKMIELEELPFTEVKNITSWWIKYNLISHILIS